MYSAYQASPLRHRCDQIPVFVTWWGIDPSDCSIWWWCNICVWSLSNFCPHADICGLGDTCAKNRFVIFAGKVLRGYLRCCRRLNPKPNGVSSRSPLQNMSIFSIIYIYKYDLYMSQIRLTWVYYHDYYEGDSVWLRNHQSKVTKWA